jgi:hypothetical protein
MVTVKTHTFLFKPKATLLGGSRFPEADRGTTAAKWCFVRIIPVRDWRGEGRLSQICV